MPTEVNESNFDTEVLKADKAIVDFWAEWCGPCKILGPRFDELSKEMKDIRFCKLNVDDNQQVAAKYGVRSIPTLLMFKNGKPAGTIIGALPKESLKEKVEQVFS